MLVRACESVWRAIVDEKKEINVTWSLRLSRQGRQTLSCEMEIAGLSETQRDKYHDDKKQAQFALSSAYALYTPSL